MLQSFEARLRILRDEYRRSPSEQSRYRLAKVEQLIAQWAPERLGAN
ncbi:MAG: hypothetical protein VKO65_04620 [Cyanobacteriota bacterium]|nr:hypothetical protein [Cyanobacteriota bacterium]